MGNISLASGPTDSSNQPILTREERHQILVEWNDTATSYPHDRTIHQLFEVQAEATADATAVIFNDEQLSYRQLNRRANQLAHHLRSLGVGPDVVVGLCCERSLSMVEGVLGILKAGGAYVPLDPQYPEKRLAFMVNDAQVAVLLTQEHLLIRLPPVECPVICLDSHHFLPKHDNPTPQAEAHNLAYLI